MLSLSQFLNREMLQIRPTPQYAVFPKSTRQALSQVLFLQFLVRTPSAYLHIAYLHICRLPRPEWLSAPDEVGLLRSRRQLSFLPAGAVGAPLNHLAIYKHRSTCRLSDWAPPPVGVIRTACPNILLHRVKLLRLRPFSPQKIKLSRNATHQGYTNKKQRIYGIRREKIARVARDHQKLCGFSHPEPSHCARCSNSLAGGLPRRQTDTYNTSSTPVHHCYCSGPLAPFNMDDGTSSLEPGAFLMVVHLLRR
jgi:hypothetical protein